MPVTEGRIIWIALLATRGGVVTYWLSTKASCDLAFSIKFPTLIDQMKDLQNPQKNISTAPKGSSIDQSPSFRAGSKHITGPDDISKLLLGHVWVRMATERLTWAVKNRWEVKITFEKLEDVE